MARMALVVVLLVAAAAIVAHAESETAAAYNYGLDVSVLVSEAEWKCMRSSNPPISHAVIRGSRSTGSSDPNAVQSLKNAIAAGYDKSNLGVYIFPRPLNSAGVIQDGSIQFNSMMTNLINNGGGDLFSMIFLDIEGGSLYWSSSTSKNVLYIQQMMAAARKYQPKYQLGLYTSKSQWSPIVGSWTGGADWPLWYASYNGRTDFSDFTPFAGWTAPSIHQYAGDKTVCKVGCDQNVALQGTLSSIMAQSRINGGSGPAPAPVAPIANSAKCAAVRGVCQNIGTNPCVGTVQHGLCPGTSSIVCCVGAPVLKSSSPGAVTPAPAHTNGRIVAEAIDTGKVTWHHDRRGRRAYRKMKMGTLMRIKHHKRRRHHKKKMIKATTARARDD